MKKLIIDIVLVIILKKLELIHTIYIRDAIVC